VTSSNYCSQPHVNKPESTSVLVVTITGLDEPTRTALLPYEPIDFVGKPVLPVVLQRALKKAEGLTDL
jgi:hypothetical protein